MTKLRFSLGYSSAFHPAGDKMDSMTELHMLGPRGFFSFAMHKEWKKTPGPAECVDVRSFRVPHSACMSNPIPMGATNHLREGAIE
jgi:hypothetical protein